MTPKGAQPLSNLSRFLIITLLINYNNNVFYFLLIYGSGFISVPKKERKKFCFWSIAQDVWSQIFHDKYHDKKKRKVNRMFLYLHTCFTYANAKIWFASKTFCSIFPQDLNEMFVVFYVKKIWSKYARLKKADLQEYNKLITWYKVVLNRKTNTASKQATMN